MNIFDFKGKNLIVISGEPDTGKTTMARELHGKLPNSVILETDWLIISHINMGILIPPEKYKDTYGKNLGAVINEMCLAWRNDLRDLLKFELQILYFNNDTVITEGYLWGIPEFRCILIDYENVCFIHRRKDRQFTITMNEHGKTVGDLAIKDQANEVIQAIKADAIERVIPSYGWYQSFDFLPKPASSNSAGKLAALNLPEHMLHDTVLDIGCNTGYFSLECARRGAKVIGIEKIEFIVDIAKRIQRNIYFQPNVRFYAMDTTDDLSQLGRFTYILVLGLFHYIVDQEDTLNRLMNILLPEGKLKLEVGIHPSEANKTIIVDGKSYPTLKRLESWLNGYDYNIVPSVNQAGDAFPRSMVTVTK